MFRFSLLQPDDAALTLSWRTEPRVARYQLSEITPDLGRQRAWIEGLAARTDYIAWMMSIGGEDLGVASFSDIDWGARTCLYGYYIGDEKRLGSGGLIPAFLLNFLFFQLRFEKVFTVIFAENQAAIAIARYFRFRHLQSEAAYMPAARTMGSLEHYELSREEWLAQKTFHRFTAELPLPPHLEGL